MQNTSDESGSRSPERLNYFNYFTEVEEEFVRRRGKQMLISPMDWALVESWKNAGIPLHIVLRAINKAFDAYDARARKFRKINSLFYCQQEVEATFAEHRLAQVGGSSTTDPAPKQNGDASPKSEGEAFPRDVILEFLARCDHLLSEVRTESSSAGALEFQDAIQRARGRLKQIITELESSARVNAEALERDLDAIDRMILESTVRACSEEQINTIRKEAESQLRSYRKKMDKAIYEQTVQNFVARRLREMNNIPRLSLFYL